MRSPSSPRWRRKSGRTPIIYTSPSFINYDSYPGFGKYPLWIANWGVNCPNLPNNTWANWDAWQYTDKGSVNGISGAVDRDRFNGTRADLDKYTNATPPAVLPHGNGNDALSVVNWVDGHSELFATSPGGDMLRMNNTAGKDDWTMPAVLDGNAGCGFASAFWGAPFSYPEVFSPLKSGNSGHLWYTGGKGWNTFQDYKGANLGLSHFSTVVWANGTTEVFALGKDGAIYTTGGSSAWPTGRAGPASAGISRRARA